VVRHGVSRRELLTVESVEEVVDVNKMQIFATPFLSSTREKLYNKKLIEQFRWATRLLGFENVATV
jgi:hypothetical protein